MKILLGSFSALLVLVALMPPAQAVASDPGADPKVSRDEKGWEAEVGGKPGVAIPDRYHPDKDKDYSRKNGGKVIVHISSHPKHMNYTTENSATTRRILREVHETLLERDWETWEFRPILAESWVEEDTLVLVGGRGDDNANIYYGKITEEGDEYVVTPLSQGNKLGKEVKRVKKAEGMDLQLGNVFTFKLHENVKWHDGKSFDANDVAFSHSIYKNSHVDCESARYKFKGGFTDVIDSLNIRIFYDKQYFLSADSFQDLTILPSHIYNLKDPENPAFKADVTDAEQGNWINENPTNRMFIGLGPYRIVEFQDEFIEAVKFEGYFNPKDAGHVDTIRWRHISSDETAKQAVLERNIDYWERLRPEDYFGEYVAQEVFTENFYKGLASFNYMGYTAWNCRREKFKDPMVRLALAHTFDWEDYIATEYKGLAARMTGTSYFFSPRNDRSIAPVPYDLEAAEDLLLEAGWYDHDDDGVIDKDGIPFKIEFLMPTGNKASKKFATKFQENLSKIGIKVSILTREWATFLEALYEREFDCANLAWITPVESDPEQIWKGYQADVLRSSNNAGFKSDKVDVLIEKIQREMDEEVRTGLFKEMQAEIYALQPYMFGLNQPKKFAMSKRIRNLKTYGIDPGYRIRDWYVVDNEAGSSSASDPK